MRTTLLWLAMTAALFSVDTARGAIAVTPAAPTAGDTVTIRLENSFGSEARATSATIMQGGNAFAIQQNVELACLLPSSPIVASEFQMGPLPVGTYSVTANITFTSVDPIPCVRAPITQAGAFNVAPSAAIPTLSSPGLVLLGVVLAEAALLMLRT